MPLTIQNLASRLTFRQLQVFKAVYDLKNYSKAGELLGLTQPAISSQVRHLEQALGLPMFEYVGRKLYCTAAGEEMAKCVRSVFAALGVAVLPKLGVLSELALGSLSIVNIAGFPLRRSWCVVYPQARHPTPAMRAFIDYVQQNIRRFEQLFLRRSGK